jgi:hypothetical protein
MSDRRKRGRPKKATAAKKGDAGQLVQLTIAAYGRKKKTSPARRISSENDEDEESSTTASFTITSEEVDEEEEEELLDETPIVLSLPVTDAMEDKFTNQHTLDDELTSYRPDDILDQPAPLAIVSGSGGHPLKNPVTGTKRLTVKRCPLCMDKPGPCDNCREKFNQQVTRSLSDFLMARDQQDQLFGAPDPSTFRNDTISDTPLPSDFKPPVYHHTSGIEATGSELLTGQPQGYSETGWDTETTQHTGTLTQAQREQYQQQEMDRLRRKIAQLEDMLATRLSTITPARAAVNNPFTKECMWHMEPFSTEPVGLPIKYDRVTGTFDTIGCFCSLQCAYAYRLEHRSAEAAPLWMLFKAHRMLQQQLEEDDDQVLQKTLIPAPPRQALKRWGGAMDLDEFLSQTQVWHTLSRYPFIPTQEFVESSSSSSEKRAKSHRAPSTGVGSDGLVRRRTKPHPNAANQWNNAIRRSRLRREA